MKHSLLRLVAVAAIVAGAIGSTSAPAHADHGVVGAHWGTYKWWGQQQVAARGFWVLDRSGDPTVGAALREFINTYNADAHRRGVAGYVPVMAYLDQSYHRGACDGFTAYAGFSFSTVCSGNGGNYGSSITWFGGAGSRAELGYHPWSLIQRDYPDYNTTFSNVAHEILHQLGIGHSYDCNNLMGGGEHGCRLQVGVKRYLTEHDWAALIDHYRRLPMN
ncbi:MAG TPA: hypothetical protein VHH09_01395 [Acidimicrobiales bacterium]|nr:hypothetical protein [Acidimicrobiales bacterium]